LHKFKENGIPRNEKIPANSSRSCKLNSQEIQRVRQTFEDVVLFKSPLEKFPKLSHGNFLFRISGKIWGPKVPNFRILISKN